MDAPQHPLDDPDYFTLSPSPSTPSLLSPSSIPSTSASSCPSPTSPSSKYLEFVPRVSSPLTSPPLSPHGNHDAYSNSHYSDVFAALVGMEGPWGHGRRRRRRTGQDVLDEEQQEGEECDEEGKRKWRSSSHLPHVHIERLIPWRRSPHSTPLTPLTDPDHTPSDSETDLGPPGIRQQRRGDHRNEDDGVGSDSTEAEAMDLGATMRRELRERKHRRWDPARDEERRGGGVTLAQLLAEELVFARALETLEERESRGERSVRDRVEESVAVGEKDKEKGGKVEEKVEFVEGSGEECRSDDGHGVFEVLSEGGHGSAEGGSDESGTSGLSGSTDSSEETSDGHGVFLRPRTPARPKRGRSKLRRRKPPQSCAHQRSRSEVPIPSRIRNPSLDMDGEANVGCLPCSLGVRRSLRRLSFKLKLRRPEEISPALQALVERPMSPEEYHQYFLSLYLKEGSSSSEPSDSERPPIHGGGQREIAHYAGGSGSETGMDGSMREVILRPEHIRASTR